MINAIDDVRIRSIRPLISPALLMDELALTTQASNTITATRSEATDIIKGKNDKLLVIVGPCSIHDTKAALEYGGRLKKLINKYQNELCIIMRVYFEKPRTTMGWKGLINDPHLNDQFDINHGLRLARSLLLELNTQGIACATEFLDMIIPQFISDLISWGAIGARTTESQVHRELASGLSMPTGFKNGTNGDIQIAIDAIKAAQYPHHFLSVTKAGFAAIISTTGNDACHLILRGSNQGSNYSADNISAVCKKLTEVQLTANVMVDCSHGNSNKQHEQQIVVAKEVAAQIAQGSRHIMGVMLESHLVAGKQTLQPGKELVYGQSITDACMGWENTEQVIEQFALAVQERRAKAGL